jgi:hypothetical protein
MPISIASIRNLWGVIIGLDGLELRVGLRIRRWISYLGVLKLELNGFTVSNGKSAKRYRR